MASQSTSALSRLTTQYVGLALQEQFGTLALPYWLVNGTNFEEEMKRALVAKFLEQSCLSLFVTAGDILTQPSFIESERKVQELRFPFDRQRFMAAADNNRATYDTAALPKFDTTVVPFMTLMAAAYGDYLEKGGANFEVRAGDPDQQLRLAAALLCLQNKLKTIVQEAADIYQAQTADHAIDIAVGFGFESGFQKLLDWVKELPTAESLTNSGF
jgi:hypothetical protein